MADDYESKTLVEYLPAFLRDYYEYEQLFKSGDIEVNSIDKAVDYNFDSAFISECDESVLSKYEDVLGIASKPTETIEQRKTNVKVSWNSVASMTFSQLKKLLNEICSSENYSLNTSMLYFGKLLLYCNVHKVPIDTVNNLIKTWLPMNIDYDINGTSEEKQQLNIGVFSKIEENYSITVENYIEDETLVMFSDDNEDILLDDNSNILIPE